MTNSIIPFLTTHIVVGKFTPVLKQTLNMMHSKAIEGCKEQSGKIFGSFLNIQVVTIEWLKQCFMQEKRLPEIKYFPLEARVDGSVHSEQTQVKKIRKSVQVKNNIFMGGTFAIRADSFPEMDEAQI